MIANAAPICTGAAVRLSSSGLGCPDWPDWPRCTRTSVVAARSAGQTSLNTAIEFSNRLLTFPLAAIAALTFIACLCYKPGGRRRRDLAWLSAALPAGVAAQAVAGGIVVLTRLTPAMVAFMSLLIAVPTGVKFFNCVGTMWHGQLTFEPPMLYTIGFLVTFLFGGITGVILASPPLNFAVSDSYFIVAHFHYVLAGTVLFAMFAGFYFWWPKMTGTMLNSRLGKIQFWVMFIGYHMTFLVQHWIGVEGMPRRVANYPLLPGNVTTLNIISTVGSWILALSILMFLWNVYITWRYGNAVA